MKGMLDSYHHVLFVQNRGIPIHHAACPSFHCVAGNCMLIIILCTSAVYEDLCMTSTRMYIIKAKGSVTLNFNLPEGFN
jgi:hypothetical protein